jgi:sugar phosphate isomerase/epimerase
MLIRCYEELARYVENTDARITVENFTSPETSVEDRMAFLDKIDHPQVGMILDIGHVRNADGENPMTVPGEPTRVIDTCARRLFHVHLHGFKDGKDHHPPFVEGDGIQWIELFQMLYKTSYPGYMNFEPVGEPIHQGAMRAVAGAPEQLVAMNAQTR